MKWDKIERDMGITLKFGTGEKAKGKIGTKRRRLAKTN